MSYKTNRQKVKEFIENNLFNTMAKAQKDFRDVDYNLVVAEITAETGASKNLVNEMLNLYIMRGDLREERILYLTSKAKERTESNQKVKNLELSKEVDEVIKDGECEGK